MLSGCARSVTGTRRPTAPGNDRPGLRRSGPFRRDSSVPKPKFAFHQERRLLNSRYPICSQPRGMKASPSARWRSGLAGRGGAWRPPRTGSLSGGGSRGDRCGKRRPITASGRADPIGPWRGLCWCSCPSRYKSAGLRGAAPKAPLITNRVSPAQARGYTAKRSTPVRSRQVLPIARGKSGARCGG